jgi:hypothetical protein
MIETHFDGETAVLHVRPLESMEESDFAKLAGLVDPYISEKGGLSGLVIEVDRFPGWKNLAGMVGHIRFVKDHHRKIGKVAFVTDAVVGELAEKVGSHFVAAEVRHFPAGQVQQAKEWIQGTP